MSLDKTNSKYNLSYLYYLFLDFGDFTYIDEKLKNKK